MNFPQYAGDLSTYLTALRSIGFDTQIQSARYFAVHPATISRYESGKVPATLDYLIGLLQKAIERHERIAGLPPPLCQEILQGVNEVIRDHCPGQAFFANWNDLLAFNIQPRSEWTTAPDIPGFYGRQVELDQLTQWTLQDRSRLIAILGAGGIGKTTLATHHSQIVRAEFQSILWKSLRNAPLPEDVLADCLQFFSGPHGGRMPKDWDQQITALIACLRNQRCLLVIDNFEAVLQEGEHAGAYREGYAAYGDLLRQIGATQHSSCLIITSREQPREVAGLERLGPAVKVIRLGGITPDDALAMLQGKSLNGGRSEWEKLVAHFSGNPKALQLVSGTIITLYSGDIGQFLNDGAPIFGDVRELLCEQFQRLSKLESDLMFWLAVEREPVQADLLGELLLQDAPRGDVLDALSSLQQRFLLECSLSGFSLQNLIMEYVTDLLVDRVCVEIESGQLQYFNSHALARAQVKEFIRQTQFRLIVAPIARRLMKLHGRAVDVQNRIMHLLADLKTTGRPRPGYAGGNALKLLRGVGADLTGADFSRLTLWDVDSRDSGALGANFSYSDLRRSIFTETFSRVLALAFSPDGTLLAAGTTGGEILIIRTADFSTLWTCRGHTDWVRSLVFSADSSLLVSASDDQTIRLWNLEIGQSVRVLSGHVGRVLNVSLHPRLPVVASSGEDLTIRFWNLETGQCFWSWPEPHEKWVFSLVFCLGGQELISASSDQTIKIWDLNSLRIAYSSSLDSLHPSPQPPELPYPCLRVLKGHTSYVWSLILDREDTLIASGGHDETVRLWNLADGRLLNVLEGHPGGARSLALSPDQHTLAVACKEIVRIWDLETKRLLKTILAHTASVWGVAFSPDGQLLVTGSQDRTIRFWSTQDYESIFTLRGYCASITTLAFHPTHKILASGAEDRTLRLWDIEMGKCFEVLEGHKDCPRTVVFSPDGKWLASKGEDHIVRIWDVNTGKNQNSFSTRSIGHIQFSPDSQQLIVASDHTFVRVWDIASGQWARTLQEHGSETYSLALSPDQRFLAAGCENDTVYLWDWATGELRSALQGHAGTVWSVAFSPDSTRLASASADRTLRLWDVNTCQTVQVLAAHTDQVKFVAFSPRGDVFASAGYDHELRLWDARDGACRRVLKGHTAPLSSLAFDASGTILASGGQDETIQVWDVVSGERLRTLKAPRPYEGINIYGVTGITKAQREKIKKLGAVEME